MTIFKFVLGLIPLLLVLYVLYAFRVAVLRQLVMAMLQMVGVTTATAVCLYLVVRADSLLVSILFVVVMAVAGAVLTLRKSHVANGKYIIPIAVGTLLSVVVLTVYALLLVFSAGNPFNARMLVPLAGMLTGAMVGANAKALAAYYAGLRHHNALYYYLIGNGATHGEAVRYFFKRSLEAGATAWGRMMSYIAIGSTPVIMWAMVMNGSGIAVALAWQLLLVALMFAASVFSIVVTLFAARRYSFDEYDKLKEGGQ